MYYVRRYQNEPLEAYYRQFKSAVNTAKLLKASFTLHEGMIESVKDDNPGLEDKQINKIASDKFLGILYLTNADKDKYQDLWRELRNNLALGTNNYPANMTVAQNMLFRYSTETVETNRPYTLAEVKASDEQSVQSETPILGTNGKCNTVITCYKCGNKGHITPFCPVTESVQATQLTFTMKSGNKMFPNIWILLDSCSSISSTSAVDLVRDIEQAKQPTRAWTNDAFIDYNLQCKLNILNGMTAYFN